MVLVFYRDFLARLAAVCRYFASYAARELCRHLDFDGGWRPSPSTQSEPSFAAILTKLHLMATLSSDVKVSHVHDWMSAVWQLGDPGCNQVTISMTVTFQGRFPLLLSRLNNLATLTLSNAMISDLLLQSMGRLGGLQEVIICKCMAADSNEAFIADPPKGPLFGIHEKPFPALRELAISGAIPYVLEEALFALGGAPTLRVLDITRSCRLSRLLPHISPQLVSFAGSISAMPVPVFSRFLKAHAALQDLAVYPMPFFGEDFAADYSKLVISPDDVPNLRSFCGPFSLVSKFLHSRPAIRLSLGLHPFHDPTFSLPSMYGLTVFPSPQSGRANWHYSRYVGPTGIHHLPEPGQAQVSWDTLETVGGV
ncbi:hypothetical protein JB92DRAFT_1197078 [Gautieria morchelliformis]|nr:hypothetical protein JB92DRAFT_1197078 [Gautieria morchelliformis]